MAQSGSFSVFLSAVSNELASYRTEVARVLRRRGIEVRDQEHFRQGDGTLVEQLRDYIRECDAVILLVGDQCGSLVARHAAVLGKNDWFDQFEQATGFSQASYTEFLLAKQFGKPTYTFLTAAGFQPDKPVGGSGDTTHNQEDTPQQQQCQTEYRKWIEQIGEHYDPLTTKAKLVEDVLVLPFPDLGAAEAEQLAVPVATALNNLALLLQDTNRLAEAEPLMGRAVEIFRASLGEEHPNTVMAVENYRRLREELNIE